jgi:hypothetical protein
MIYILQCSHYSHQQFILFIIIISGTEHHKFSITYLFLKNNLLNNQDLSENVSFSNIHTKLNTHKICPCVCHAGMW